MAQTRVELLAGAAYGASQQHQQRGGTMTYMINRMPRWAAAALAIAALGGVAATSAMASSSGSARVSGNCNGSTANLGGAQFLPHWPTAGSAGEFSVSDYCANGNWGVWAGLYDAAGNPPFQRYATLQTTGYNTRKTKALTLPAGRRFMVEVCQINPSGNVVDCHSAYGVG
jgi:hypothetical protein